MPGRLRVAATVEQCWHRVPGGTARAAVETLGAVVAAHPDVEVVGVAARHRTAAADPYRPPVPVQHLPLPRRALYESWHRVRRPAVQRATGPVDVIHATGIAMPPPSAPVVWTIHDLAWRRDPSTFTAHGVRFFEQALHLAIADARVVLCPSQATLADAVEAGIPAERVRLVPLGVRAARVDPSAVTAVRRRHALERPYVLSVGTAEPRKNLVALIDAFRSLRRRPVDLVLVGPEGWGPALGPRLDALGERARPLGFVSDADLAALYAGATAFAYPSRWEGFGLPVLEAMAHGAPVVTSVGTACAEVAGDAALLVEPDDVDGLAAAIRTLLDDDDLVARLRRDGPARARHFRWEDTASGTVAAYREAVA